MYFVAQKDLETKCPKVESTIDLEPGEDLTKNHITMRGVYMYGGDHIFKRETRDLDGIRFTAYITSLR